MKLQFFNGKFLSPIFFINNTNCHHFIERFISQLAFFIFSLFPLAEQNDKLKCPSLQTYLYFIACLTNFVDTSFTFFEYSEKPIPHQLLDKCSLIVNNPVYERMNFLSKTPTILMKAVSILRADKRNLAYSILSSYSYILSIVYKYQLLLFLLIVFSSIFLWIGNSLGGLRLQSQYKNTALFQQNQNKNPMEELYEQVAQRCLRIQEVAKAQMTSQRFRVLKEQQKARCEKQNFIISMMRANKSMQIMSKNLYFKYSLEIMKKINPQFKHDGTNQKADETFLNDFVGLYRHFFYKYEEMFNFKMKIQSLIRPTNHNLIVDLIKYLVDFSRDYYQHTFFWCMKSMCKLQKDEPEQQNLLIEKDETVTKKIVRSSLNQIILQKSISKRIDECQSATRKDPFKSYDVLQIQSLPAIATQTKDVSTNIDVLKMRINDIYRDMKSRNIPTKSACQNYYNKYFNEKTSSRNQQTLQFEDQSMNKATHPFKITLVIEKNGFNYINASISENRYYSKSKDKKLSPLKISQRVIPMIQTRAKPQYMLTSLKVIRISENFLPPIIAQQNILNPVTINTVTNLSLVQNSTRINLVSSSSAANQDQIQRKMKRQSQYQISQPIPRALEQKIQKQKSFRKLNQLKKSFRSQEKRQGGILPISSNPLGKDDPEKKIYDWLQKLRQIKQIERKKIMGLS